jgi:signal transduction histidine kinase
MTSLRTRIALSYGALIVSVIVLAALAIDYGFGQILQRQAQLRMTNAADQIVRSLDSLRAMNFFEPEALTGEVYRIDNLDHWAGPFAYLQIDTPTGYPQSKSSNMGALAIPPPTSFDHHESYFVRERLSDGREVLVLNRILRVDGTVIAIAQLAEPLDNMNEVLAQARTVLALSALVGALLVGAASFFIAGTAIDPIKRLTRAMAEIGSDQLNRRITTTRTDEVGRLAAAFNAMLSRLEEAFARERQFIADASHELRTPLTVINANAQLLRRWGTGDPTVRDESIDEIITESQQLAEMVSGMLTLAKADSGDQIPREPLALGRLLDETVAHARPRAEGKGLVIDAHIPAHESLVSGDETLLRQMFTNLIDNAIKFTEQGRIDVTLDVADERARVAVADTGAGIEAETAERLFDRFFRSDLSHSRSIEGTGLGLAIVRSIARVHGGTVRAQRRDGGGSVFTVVLPLLPAIPTER